MFLCNCGKFRETTSPKSWSHYTGNNNESSYKVSSALDYLKIRLDDTSSVPATETDCDGDEQSVVSTPADASLLRLHSAHPTRK